MSQIKIYGLKTHLTNVRTDLSNAIHQCVVEVLKLPENKRFHRFIGLEEEDFIFPEDRSDTYIIIEIMMIEGRTDATKKQLIQRLFQEINAQVGILVDDIEICMVESPPVNWGFRGKTGDKVNISYKVDI